MSKKMNSILKSLFFIALLAIVISSCKKDDPDPDYVGTWYVTGSAELDDGSTVEMKEVMKLNEGSFSDVIQVKNPDTNKFLDYMGTKGTMTVNGNRMTVTVNEAGVSTFDVSGIPTGTINYYKSNQTEFTTLMALLEMPTTFQSEYEIAGNQLTLRTDYNADSDFTDDGEVTVYTRQ